MSAGNFLNDMPKTVKTWANGFRTLVHTTYEKGEDYRQGVFNIETTENLEDRDVEIGGIEDFETWEEGQPAPLDNIREGFEVRYRQVSWGKRVAFGRLARKFYANEPRKTTGLMKKLGLRAYELEQTKAFDIFRRGRDVTFDHGYGDGKTVFSVAHPLSPYDATTWSNIVADSATLSEPTLMEMIEMLDQTPDDKGKPMHLGRFGYIVIVTNPTQYFAATRILDPSAKERPGTPNREINVLNGQLRGLGRPIEVRWVPYAHNTDYPNAFYVVAKEEHNLNILVSEKFNTDDYIDDHSKTLFVRGSTIFAVGLGSPRGIVASLGDGATAVVT